MEKIRLGWCVLALPVLLLSGEAVTGEVKSYSPVTDQRLANPEPGNWLMYRRTYDGANYSPLNKINVGNAKDLTPVWTFSSGVIEGHEAPPIVNNGVMFVSTPEGQVLALDAKTGDLFWRTSANCPKIYSSCIRPTAASRSGKTRSISPPPIASSWRLTPALARNCGRRRSRTTRRATT